MGTREGADEHRIRYHPRCGAYAAADCRVSWTNPLCWSLRDANSAIAFLLQIDLAAPAGFRSQPRFAVPQGAIYNQSYSRVNLGGCAA